jgi:hypothetical protein
MPRQKKSAIDHTKLELSHILRSFLYEAGEHPRSSEDPIIFNTIERISRLIDERIVASQPAAPPPIASPVIALLEEWAGLAQTSTSIFGHYNEKWDSWHKDLAARTQTFIHGPVKELNEAELAGLAAEMKKSLPELSDEEAMEVAEHARKYW